MTRKNERPAFFVSHAAADKVLAELFAEIITDITNGMSNGFVSTRSDDIPTGKGWFESIHKALDKSRLTVVLLTPNSFKRQWVLYEYGYASSRVAANRSSATKVVPILIGMDFTNLEGPFPSTQIRKLSSEMDFHLILKDLISAFDGSLDQSKLDSLTTKFYQRIGEISANLALPVDPERFGITGIFPGLIREDLNVLRSFESAKKRIVIAGPSLARPLMGHLKDGLRERIKGAITKGVNVFIFLANPILSFEKDNPNKTVADIKSAYANSNTDDVLHELKLFYTELGTISAEAMSMLHVFLVNKASLDFAIICDDSTVLCRSTIHWSPYANEQKEMAGHPEHDYKPPIIEARPIKMLKDSFFAEYRNYLENLMFAAELPAAEPDNPGLVRRLFEVQNVSPALKI